MLKRILNEYRLRRSWAVIEQCKRDRARRERNIVRATARQMCREMGRPVPRALAES